MQAFARGRNFEILPTTLSVHGIDFAVPNMKNGNPKVVMPWG
jgi:hypothetical protein